MENKERNHKFDLSVFHLIEELLFSAVQEDAKLFAMYTNKWTDNKLQFSSVYAYFLYHFRQEAFSRTETGTKWPIISEKSIVRPAFLWWCFQQRWEYYSFWSAWASERKTWTASACSLTTKTTGGCSGRRKNELCLGKGFQRSNTFLFSDSHLLSSTTVKNTKNHLLLYAEPRTGCENYLLGRRKPTKPKSSVLCHKNSKNGIKCLLRRFFAALPVVIKTAPASSTTYEMQRRKHQEHWGVDVCAPFQLVFDSNRASCEDADGRGVESIILAFT